MTQGSIPDDVISFTQRNIDSMADLEALLILRERTHMPWDIPEIVARLYISEQCAAEVLERPRSRGLVQPAAAGFQYMADVTLDGVIARLGELYKARG